MKHNYFGKYDNTELRPLEINQIEQLRQWRNDVSLSKFLRPIKYITKEGQKKWFDDYLREPGVYVFAIYENTLLKRAVGSVAIYNIRNNKAEIGRIQIGDSDAHGLGIGKKALAIAMKIGFELLHFNLFDICVNQCNIPSYKNTVALGFTLISTKQSVAGGLEDIFEIDCDSFKKACSYYNDISIIG